MHGSTGCQHPQFVSCMWFAWCAMLVMQSVGAGVQLSLIQRLLRHACVQFLLKLSCPQHRPACLRSLNDLNIYPHSDGCHAFCWVFTSFFALTSLSTTRTLSKTLKVRFSTGACVPSSATQSSFVTRKQFECFVAVCLPGAHAVSILFIVAVHSKLSDVRCCISLVSDLEVHTFAG
jgi:hypothetical protein